MEKFKTINLKNNQQAKLCILCPSQKDKEYMVLAVSDNKQVGYCYFSIKNDDCKICRIAVTNPQFLSTGLGSAMFGTMEQFASQNGAKYVSGIFVARGYPNAHQMTSKFYKNHGFVPEDEEFFDREDIFKKIMPQTNFDVPVIANNELYNQLSHYNFSVNDMFSSSKKEDASEPQFDL